MRRILYCWVLILLIFPLSANATLSDDVRQFEQKYAEIYENIDPALAIKMEIFLQDVVDYVVIHYTTGQDINVQIKNGVGSVLLTGDKYKNDLLPFMLEQSENTELYQAQLSEMQSIVRKEVEKRLASSGPAQVSLDAILLINKDNAEDVRQYNYIQLNNSLACYKGGQPGAGLFNDYYNKIRVGGGYKVYAIHNNISKIYADMVSANVAYAYIKGKNMDGTDMTKFNLIKYTSKTDARFPNPVTVIMPATLTRVIPNIDPTLEATTEVIATPDI